MKNNFKTKVNPSTTAAAAAAATYVEQSKKYIFPGDVSICA